MLYLFITSAVVIVGLVLYKDAEQAAYEERVLESFRTEHED